MTSDRGGVCVDGVGFAPCRQDRRGGDVAEVAVMTAAFAKACDAVDDAKKVHDQVKELSELVEQLELPAQVVEAIENLRVSTSDAWADAVVVLTAIGREER